MHDLSEAEAEAQPDKGETQMKNYFEESSLVQGEREEMGIETNHDSREYQYWPYHYEVKKEEKPEVILED